MERGVSRVEVSLVLFLMLLIFDCFFIHSAGLAGRRY